jgi:hypothetical protein
MNTLPRARSWIASKHWSARATRILAVATLAVLALRDIAQAQLPSSFEWPKTNFEKAAVDMNEIMSGGPPRDGIPPVDDPAFVGVDEASAWVDPREPVIVVVRNDDARAYPIQILTWHEIVNDNVGGVPVSVTFCPLCNAAIVFDRRLDGRVLDFGTTGRLRKSDLIMYDRQTESWWQQLSGRAIIGDLLGKTLARVPAQLVAFEDFAAAHAGGRVLSRDTGHTRAYGTNPYAGYDDIDRHPFLFTDPVDPRLPAMERVLNISLGGSHRLYPFSRLRDTPVLNDEVAGTPVLVMSRPGTLSALDTATITEARTVPSVTAWLRSVDGRVLTFARRGEATLDRETGSTWNLLGQAVSGPLAGRHLQAAPGGVHFAFAWLAFNPDSDIYAP